MIRNYLKTAIRNLIRQKNYALINIAGLATGMAACLLLFMVVKYELSYDTFQPDYNNIYHVVTQDNYEGELQYTQGIPYPALEALRLDFPEAKTGGLFTQYGSQITLMKEDGKPDTRNKFAEETGLVFADPQFFEVFQYQWLSGSPAILAEPNTIVLSRSVAQKYYSDWKNAVGKYIMMDNNLVYKVSGILEDSPKNSDFELRIVGSLITIKNNPVYGYTTDWGNTTSNFQVYLNMPDNMQNADMRKRLELFSKKNQTGGNSKRQFIARPLADIHFDEIGNNGTHTVSRTTLTTLSLIGFLIILMACINFINLSTAQAVGRSKEVGVRKVLGSNRMQLFWQLMGETKLMVITATLLALFMAWLALPYIKHVVQIEENLNLLSMHNILFILLCILLLTVMAGIYPAVVLSGFKPVQALKNKINSSAVGGISLRRGLVVVQFSISQILIIGTIIAISQMNYVKNADLGFNKEAVIVLNGSTDSTVLAKQPAFKAELLQLPGIKMVSLASDVPSSQNNWSTNFAFDHKEDEKFSLYLKFTDEDYFKTFDIKFLAGKGYAKSDTMSEVVINETLLKKLGLKNADEAVGKEIRLGGREMWYRISGVIKDFVPNTLRDNISPVMLTTRRSFYLTTSVKIHSKNPELTKAEIHKLCDKFFPEYVYTSYYYDERINSFYKQEQQLSLLYKIFAGLAIFISCLGLYGLVSFMAVQKTKEVGIRKVLGAGTADIVYLFSKEFTILIVIAFVIAAPLAWYFMNTWLANFAYKISIGIWIFLVAIFASILIAWITVGYKAIQAAIVNPVKSLRSE